jgi:hypothetical protein
MDLEQLTTDELSAELKKRAGVKQNERKAYKELVNETIPGVIDLLIEASEILAIAKTNCYLSLQDLMALKMDIYEIKTTQRSHTFTDHIGRSVELGYRITDGWDDTVHVGEGKVLEYLSSLGRDANSKKLVNSINRLLKRDANNNLKASRVIELKSLSEEYNSELFNDGVSIILEAYKPKMSVYYIKAFYKDNVKGEVSIPLSISSVDFAEEVDLSIFNTVA